MLPKAPSSDPRNEIANLLHGFVRDLARHVEGFPDDDGLLQAIRPAQEKFRRAVRITVPEFQPFEKRYEKKSIGKPKFLISEEGHEDFEDSDIEDVADIGSDIAGSQDVVVTGKAIFIDEVLKRANQSVSSSCACV